jgi:hypothetical protein
MYIAGIVPGPKEPSLDQFNHFLWLLINEMENSWKHGIRYSRTACKPHELTTQSAIAIAICDLPAARKLAQYSGPTNHHLCTIC